MARRIMAKDKGEDIERGSAWTKDNGFLYRVMAIVDGYVVARHPGSIPFVKLIRDWRTEFQRVNTSAR